MKINKKKDIIFFSILTLAIIILLLIATYSISIENKLYKSEEKQKTTGVLEENKQGTKIEETFIAKHNNLQKIKIDFEPYINETKCGGKVAIGIKDSQGNIIKEETITRNYIRDKSSYTLEFKNQKDSQDKIYTIYIRFDDLENYEKFYTVKITNENQIQENKMYIDGQEQENTSIIFQEFYKSNKRVLLYTSMLLIMIIGIYIISSIIYYKKDIKIENIFLMIVPFAGLFVMLAMPTFKNHDEYYHWLKAYEISEGKLMTPIEKGVPGSFMPRGITEIFLFSEKYGYSNIPYKMGIELNKEDKAFLSCETAAVYSFVSYMPQAIGINIGKLLTNKAFLITYAGRLMNLIVSITALYFAIKMMPFGKKLLLIPAMIPIALEGFASLSADAMTVSISFLYIAYILNLAFGSKEKIGTKEKIILSIMSIVVALCKIVYLPLVGLILIIPKEKFKNSTNKNKIINFCIIALLAIIVNLIWLAIAGKYLSNFRDGDSEIKVMLALSNPIKYIQQMLYTMHIKGNEYLLTLFGSELAWLESIRLDSIVTYTLIAVYLFVGITDNEIKGKLKNYQLIWILLVILAVVVLVMTSLYVQWTVVGSDIIEGVQGRYFLPILPLIMILLGSVLKINTSYKEENINKFSAIAILVVQIYTISQIMVTYL